MTIYRALSNCPSCPHSKKEAEQIESQGPMGTEKQAHHTGPCGISVRPNVTQIQAVSQHAR